MQLPRYVDIGSGNLDNIPQTLESMKIKGSFLVVTGATATLKYGRRVFDLISSAFDADLISVSGSKKEANGQVVSRLSGDSVDYLIAVGGGRVIDVAKFAASSTESEFISLPTSLSHDGIASSRVSTTGRSWS